MVNKSLKNLDTLLLFGCKCGAGKWLNYARTYATRECWNLTAFWVQICKYTLQRDLNSWAVPRSATSMLRYF